MKNLIVEIISIKFPFSFLKDFLNLENDETYLVLQMKT